MDDVITLSSDDSDVEVVGSFSEFTTKSDPLPLSEVRVDIEAVNVNIPPRYIDLTDPRWAFPELKFRKRQNSPATSVIDLTSNDVIGTEVHTEQRGTEVDTKPKVTEVDTKPKVTEVDTKLKVTEVDTEQKGTDVDTEQKGTDVDAENLSPERDSQFEKDNKNDQDFSLPESVLRDSSTFFPKQECGTHVAKQRRLNSPEKHKEQNQRALSCSDKLAVKLKRLPFLESHAMELRTSGCSVHLAKDSSHLSLSFNQLKSKTEARECNSIFRTTASSSVSHKEPLFVQCPPEVVKSATAQQENSMEVVGAQMQNNESQHQQSPDDSLCLEEQSSITTSAERNVSKNEKDSFHSSDCLPSSVVTHLFHDKPQGEALCSNLEQLDLDKAESGKICTPDHPFLHSPSLTVNSYDDFSNISSKSNYHKDQIDPSPISEYVPSENTQEWQFETVTYKEDMGVDSPLSLLWQGESEEEDVNEENRFGMNFRAVSREDRQFVCPVALRKVMAEPAQAPTREDDDSFGSPEVLCRQSLSLVYSTIDENYPEGTLQLLSDLMQPGYYPPKDITAHLLHGILLDPQCPYHLCVQAFNLLMRSQRHHMATKSTVPWDWDLLTSIISSERLRCEIVRMFLEYVVQTLEDDFKAKCSSSALHQSIAKGTLSCDQQFPRVRDVIKWLFSAIMKSTEHEENKETSRDREEQIRLVLIFQRMLSLALEVDRSPALNSGKLSQELFHMLLGHAPLRAHRMLLLESLQSKLMRCKLLEHLLDYACPRKISVPMSLSLLLHFLKNCTLAPDPMDGTERWQKWEELIQLLWMLLLSYNKAMKGYLCSSFSEQRSRVGMLVYKPDDMVSKSAVQEAVEAFLSRSRADLGQALPLHVEESLTYLQDHLLDVCQC